MRYRTRLAIAFALLAAFTGAVVLGIYFFGAREILFRQIRSQVLSIAATGAKQIDPGIFEQIRTRQDETSLAYALTRDTLRGIRDANRREDVNVRFVYTMRPEAAGADRWSYVVDAEEEGMDKSHVGDPVEFDNSSGIPLHMDGPPYAEKSFSTDEFGTFLSANAPIVSGDRPIGLLGVDIDAGDVLAEMNRLLRLGLAALGIAVVTAILLAIAVARRATAPLEKIREAIGQIADGRLDTRIELARRDEFGAVARAVNDMAVALRERDMLKGALARYVSHEVADQILAENASPRLRGQRCEITVLIVDIRNFTAMSGLIPPEEVVRFLNDFFSRMIDVIFGHRGTLDKFLGDGFLAIFGAPLDDPEHGRHALEAAIAMLAAKEEMRAGMLSRHGIDLRIGIGLHSGTAVVGNIGSEQRMEYTAIGDAVNITSRIETLNKEYGTELLMSETVAAGASSDLNLREVAETRLRGVSEPMKLYTVAPADLPA